MCGRPRNEAERDAGGERLTTLEPRDRRRTIGGDKGYDTPDFVTGARACHTTPHGAQNLHARRPTSAIDDRTTRHPGFDVSQIKRKLVEESFGWGKVIGGLRKLQHRGHEKVGWVFTFTHAVYNLVRIRSDNGTPFASNALGRLSTLSVWWVQLGIWPDLIEPAHPEQNGRHERMHKTLKAETTRPPRADLGAQQRRFNGFRRRYNDERPHEGLHDATPASCYEPSPRPYRTALAPIAYPGHFERRRVSRNGGIRWVNRWVNVSHLLAELDVGFEAIDDSLWDVFFGPVWLGRFHEEVGRIVDHLGRPARRHGGNHKGA